MLVVSVYWYLGPFTLIVGLFALRLNIHRVNKPGFLFIFILFLIEFYLLIFFVFCVVWCFFFVLFVFVLCLV
jgi:hypothetical protein